jgi:hypothetical protein
MQRSSLTNQAGGRVTYLCHVFTFFVRQHELLTACRLRGRPTWLTGQLLLRPGPVQWVLEGTFPVAPLSGRRRTGNRSRSRWRHRPCGPFPDGRCLGRRHGEVGGPGDSMDLQQVQAYINAMTRATPDATATNAFRRTLTRGGGTAAQNAGAYLPVVALSFSRILPRRSSTSNMDSTHSASHVPS